MDFEFVSSSTSLTATSAQGQRASLAGSAETAEASVQMEFDPPARRLTLRLKGAADGTRRFTISDRTGLVWAEQAFDGTSINLSTEEIPAGGYTLRIFGPDGVIEERKILIRK